MIKTLKHALNLAEMFLIPKYLFHNIVRVGQIVCLVNDVKIKLSSDVTKHKLMAKAPLPWKQKPAGLFIPLLQGCRGHT